MLAAPAARGVRLADLGLLAGVLLERICQRPPPAELAALLGALNAGHGINVYLRL